MSSLFSDSTITKIKNIKKVFLWIAVCILIGELAVGVILILAQTFDLTTGKLMGTFALCALALFIGVNNFSVMEKGKSVAQGFALVGLIANMLWLFLAVLLVWEMVPYMEANGYHYGLSGVAKIMVVASDVSVVCFCISNVLTIEETLKPVKPLKIVAMVCALYFGIYAVITTLADSADMSDQRWLILAGMSVLGFIVMAIAASVVSKSGRKQNEASIATGAVDANDAVMQAKIQEMVEKEVQARLAGEQNKSTDMQPGVEVKSAPVLSEQPAVEVEQPQAVTEEPQASAEQPGDGIAQSQTPTSTPTQES